MGLDPDQIHIWSSPEGMLALTPLPNTDLWQLQATIPELVESPAPASLELYQEMLRRRIGAENVRVLDATWLSIYRANIRMVHQYRNGRLFLAGDAAHVHSPAGGQGMNTGIQDGYNLGWKLAAVLNGAPDELLDTYDEERRPVARAVLADSTAKMGALLKVTGDSGPLSRSIGALTDDLTSGLLVSYPVSALTQPKFDAGSSPAPGWRAPDAEGLMGESFDGSLFDLFRGPQWTLLAFTNNQASVPAIDHPDIAVHQMAAAVGNATAGILDQAGNAYRIYAPKGEELVLIRPDGYIAARYDSRSAVLLAECLTRWLGLPVKDAV